MKRSADRVIDIVLGADPSLRPGLARSSSASVVYFASILAVWGAVDVGLASAGPATALTLVAAFGAIGFFALIRSGMTRSFRDPTLTMPQMAFAIVAVALAYRLEPEIREPLPIILVLILVYGAFILPARRCRDLGWFAVVALGIAMASGVWYDPARFDPTKMLFPFVIVATVVPTLAYLAGELSRLRTAQNVQRRELREVMAQLQAIATHDELTGLPNRRHIQSWITHEIARSARQNAALCVALIDLDRFKRINDRFGHAAGDETLRTFAREAQTALRAGDVLARWGGEEFLLVMPDTTIDAASCALKRLRAHIARPDSWRDCPRSRVTFSAGLATLNVSQSLEDALRRVDAALYRAKDAGRDRTVVADAEPSPAPLARATRA